MRLNQIGYVHFEFSLDLSTRNAFYTQQPLCVVHHVTVRGLLGRFVVVLVGVSNISINHTIYTMRMIK